MLCYACRVLHAFSRAGVSSLQRPALIVLAATLTYWNSLSIPFILDDPANAMLARTWPRD